MTLKDLIQSCFGKNFAGNFSMLYLICAKDILLWPALKTTEAVGDSITFASDVILNPGATIGKIAIVVDTGEITHTALGTRSAKSIGNSYNFKILKTKAADEWMNENLNMEVIAFVKEKMGFYRVFGNPDVPAQISTAEGKTGNTLETEKAWNLQISDSVGGVAPYLEVDFSAIDNVAINSASKVLLFSDGKPILFN
jgi:hypothetical protein